MEQFKMFSMEKQDVVATLTNIKKIVTRLGTLGVDIDEDLSKIEHAIRNIQDDVLRIALLGAFSDGKTSVVAGWLGQVMTNMKIDTNESSDQLAIYHPDNLPEKCEIVDTPGLFGDKETETAPGNVVQYGDITKKYLSEAHLIFYVVDATNPLKDSHKDVVKWILRDLNKLSSTIFIINKMDEVADLRDPEEFDSQAQIKRDNLLSKLCRFADLSPAETKAINIVCISSNPNNRGLDYWFDKRETYEERSRIGALKSITNTLINGVTRDVLVKKTGMDVITDLLKTKIARTQSEFDQLGIYEKTLASEIGRIEEDIDQARKEVITAKSDLLNDLMEYDKRLMSKVRTLSQQTALAFLQDEIGYSTDDVGFKLRLKIEQSCERCFQRSATIMKKVASDIKHQLDSSESFINSISSSALNASGKLLGKLGGMPVNTIKAGIFAARDALGSIAGIAIKFKPWEAAKLATNIGKFAGPIGAGIQLLTDFLSIKQQRDAQNALATLQTQIGDMIAEHFKGLYGILADDQQVFTNFAPEIAAFEDVLKQQRAGLAQLQEKQAILASIRGDFEKAYSSKDIIDVEFSTRPLEQEQLV
jgi:GTPase Era involved in 16S rRNA processing